MKKYRRSQRGATVVEFAIIAALVFVLIFGILELSLLFLQEHYVANAAREGVRVGVRANNFDCYKTVVGSGFTSCTSDRADAMEAAIETYLATFYEADDLTITIESLDLDAGTDVRPVLRANVDAPNLFPAFVTGILKLLKSDSDVNNPSSIGFSAQLEYEDPEEFIEEP